MERIRGLRAWNWSGHKSELDTGEKRGVESWLLEEVGGPSHMLERLAWGQPAMRS